MPGAPFANHTLRVLVVDDDPDTADSLVQVLALMGWPARAAHSSREAIDIAGAWLPQVALLDLAMPHHNGFELARSLRDVPGLAPPELVALTGVTGEEHRKQAEAAGFRAYLLKPVELPALFQILDDIANGGSAPQSREAMPGAERISGAGGGPGPGRTLLEQQARAGDWLLQGRYITGMSRALAARTRAELPLTRSLIARGRSVVQASRMLIARGRSAEARFHPWVAHATPFPGDGGVLGECPSLPRDRVGVTLGRQRGVVRQQRFIADRRGLRR